jgi:hypothetical protein
MSEEIKVAILEQKITDFERLVLKLDHTIMKMSEVNTNVSRMLAVHEERISQQEKTDEILFDKLDKLRDKIDDDNNKLLAKINFLERKVWSAIGAIAVITFLVNTKIINLKSLSSTQTSGTMEQVSPLVRELS